jgi:integron integrase
VQYSVETFRRKSPWLQVVREKMRAYRLSPRTEDAYCHWIVDLIAWSGWMKPDEITTQQVTDYLSFLAVTRKVSASTQNQAFNAILFLFRRVLEKEMGEVKAERAKVSSNVPEFVTADEFKQVVRHLTGDYRTLALLAFGTGLRLMELLRLRVKDVDFGAGLLIVRDGKGGKDRVVPLPKSLRDSLRVKIDAVSAMHTEDLAAGFGSVWLPDALAKKYPKAATDLKWQWLFTSPTICKDKETGILRRHHLFGTGFQSALKLAGEKAKLTKRVHPHALRHGHATALLAMGRSLEEVRQRLGHKDIRTTQIYLHCVNLAEAPNPVDCLCNH